MENSVLEVMESKSELLIAMAMRQLPARIPVDVTAKLLGFATEDIAIIAADAKMLKALGTPARNAPKFYATADILSKAIDQQWLDTASARVRRAHFAKRQLYKKTPSSSNTGEPNHHNG